MPDWVKQTFDQWLSMAETAHGRIFRCVCRRGVVWGPKITEKVVWRRGWEFQNSRHTISGGRVLGSVTIPEELEQIQFLLGQVSVQTTEKYLGCKQRFRLAVNDRLGIEPPT
jgi:hypothetical protein